MKRNVAINAWYLPILGLAVFLLLYCSDAAESSARWGTASDRNISSVAWSPKGDTIAFVVTRMSDVGTGDWEGPRAAEIWLYRVSPAKGQAHLKRLARVSRKKYGIPVALFWLANDRLGWAAQEPVTGERFTFLATSLRDVKPYLLVNRRFDVRQTRGYVDKAAPDDVYWDSRSNQLIFSGGAYIKGVGWLPVLCFYDMTSHMLSTKSIGGHGEGEFTFSLLHTRGSKPRYYLAGVVDGGVTWLLWESSTSSLRRDRILRETGESIYFPRVSPDGRWLAWLEGGKGGYSLVLSGVQGKRREWLGNLTFDWDGVNPNWGCPFSWSPSGDLIAMSTGPELKIIDVKPHKARLLKSPGK